MSLITLKQRKRVTVRVRGLGLGLGLGLYAGFLCITQPYLKFLRHQGMSCEQLSMLPSASPSVSLTYSAWGGILTENDAVYFVFLICLFVFPSCVFKLCVCTPAAIDAK